MYEYNAEEPMPEPKEETVMLEPALCWAHMGMPILPLKPFGKPGWSVILGTGYEVSSAGITDPERVEQVWSEHPLTNMGLVCGAVPGARYNVLVLDLDKHNEGADPIGELVQWQQTTGIRLPEGPVVETPTGGLHLYFLIEPGTERIWSGAGWLPNVDVRADGGYVVAPPSVLAVGHDPVKYPVHKFPEGWAQYRFIDMSETPYWPRPSEFFTDLENAVAPRELVEDVNTNRGTRGKAAAFRAVPEGVKAFRSQRTGRVPVAYYIEHGIPAGVVQWEELWAIAWAVHDRNTRQETFELVKHIISKSPQKALDPWVDGYPEIGTSGTTLWSIVNRCYERAELHTGDELDLQRRAEYQRQREEQAAKYAAAMPWLQKINNTNSTQKDT
jgi:hypothetical protein